MEIFIYLLITIVAVGTGFYFGASTGYNYAMDIATERKQSFMNVVMSETQDGTLLFHDMVTSRFLTQSKSIEEGKDDLTARWPDRLILICAKTE